MIELIVVVAIISILAALLPALDKARENSRRSYCMNNLATTVTARSPVPGSGTTITSIGTSSREALRSFVLRAGHSAMRIVFSCCLPRRFLLLQCA